MAHRLCLGVRLGFVEDLHGVYKQSQGDGFGARGLGFSLVG